MKPDMADEKLMEAIRICMDSHIWWSMTAVEKREAITYAKTILDGYSINVGAVAESEGLKRVDVRTGMRIMLKQPVGLQQPPCRI